MEATYVQPRDTAAAREEITAAMAELRPGTRQDERVLTAVTSALGFDLGALWRLDRMLSDLVCEAVVHIGGLHDFADATLERRFERGRGLPGYVWATGSTAWLSDLIWDPRMTAVAGAHAAGLTTAVAVPVGEGDGFDGVLELFSIKRRATEPETLEWLTSVAPLLRRDAAA
jgi:hypothetical protein